MALSISNPIIRPNEDFYPQNNGEISDSLTQNWTEQAIECYKLNGNCKECSIRKAHYSFDCQMPRVVEVLKLMNGEPRIK